MYAVGRLIGRSINTVSGPFHPFGGAVDIVVVEQPDGSFKSSPWYVRFGKFQGVLKTREKVVSICVDGVEADFHMYLDHTGEAYFLEEVEEEILLESSSSSELKYEQSNTSKPMKSLSCNFDAEGSHLARSESVASESAVTSTGSKRSRLLGMVWSRRLSQDEPSPNVSRASSLGQAEIVANLLDVNWSTELATDKPNPQKSSQLSKNLVSSDECDGDGDSIAENNVVSTSVAGSLVQEPSGLLPELSQYFCQLQIGNAGDEGERKENVRPLSDGDSPSLDSAEKLFEMNSLQDLPTAVTEESVETLKVPQSNGFIPECESTSVEDAGLTNRHTISSSLDIIHQSETDQNIKDGSHEDELFLFSDDELKPNEDRKRSSSASSSVNKEMDTLTSVGDIDSHETLDKHVITSHASLTSLDMGHQEDAQKKFEDLLEKEQQKTFFPIDIQGFHDANTEIDERMVESLPNLWSHIDSLEADHQPRHSFDATTTSPRWLNPRNSISSPRKPSEEIGLDFDKSQPTVTDEALLEAPISDSVSFGVGDPSKTIVVPSGTWRLWPFSFQRATSSKSTAPSVNPSSKTISSSDVSHSTESISSSNSVKSEVKRQVIKKKMRTITPTSAQLKSLKLKDGGNIVTFTFSTAMLGKQQVDARIYLWKWNARIVISDVDGTITRSDVLGQFMPMVGYDWSHIGVTHLFSAIKENGYQLLFLSARSISQSHLTRQFLFNLKQDGKALPDGPVVISPDGLFPSLFREVIRRAPHEFKIACLEDIRALYPADCNPFYAGFGNRDTDEISYLRVGIPEGKIFIINPRGEVAVHRRVDTNSYSDLHTLVSGMFPPNRSSEQEAFNSWNFWKLPPRMDYNI
ncbi:unnamed protein product [Rhodiola kirilowii]